jgi:hypothetical protein
MGRRREKVVALVVAFGGMMSCLPADTRPAPGSILLVVASADQPLIVTADGWSITIDRLLLAIGEASLGFNCKNYSEASYLRLLDGRVTSDQKLVLLYGLGRCYFDFHVTPPDPDVLLGEGVSEADGELMSRPEVVMPGQPPRGIAVDFAATARHAAQTKRMHWMFSQSTEYRSCIRTIPDAPSQPIELRSQETSTFHIGVRGAVLFGDDDDPATARLRFDPMAAADTVFGNDDDDVTLHELGAVSLDGGHRVRSKITSTSFCFHGWSGFARTSLAMRWWASDRSARRANGTLNRRRCPAVPRRQTTSRRRGHRRAPAGPADRRASVRG